VGCLGLALSASSGWIPSAEAAARVKARKPSQEAQETAQIKESVSHLETKVSNMENSVDKLSSEVSVLEARAKMISDATNIDFLNATYLKAGLALLVPRPSTFAFNTNAGLGAFVGVGQYLGRNHILDISFDWDVYPALSFRYRYEFHESIPLFNWGPVLGYKVQAAAAPGFDQFLANPSAVNSSFFYLGGMLSVPLNQSLATLEILYWVNGQAFVVTNFGLHFFL
jgi:hypothetical protein